MARVALKTFLVAAAWGSPRKSPTAKLVVWLALTREGGLALVRRCGRIIHLNESHLARAHTFFERHGRKTVFIGRFIALLRTWAAVLAGAAHMPCGTFMLYNALGAVCWAVIVGMPSKLRRNVAFTRCSGHRCRNSRSRTRRQVARNSQRNSHHL